MECLSCKTEMLKYEINVFGGFYYCKNLCTENLISYRNDCEHQIIIVSHTISNGNTQVRKQCTKCGILIGSALKRTDFDVIRTSQPLKGKSDFWQKEVYEKYNEQNEKYKEKRLLHLSENIEIEKQRYNEYLNSSEWKAKRLKVLLRDNYTCQGCQCKNKELDIHHLSYANKYDELLFQLVSLCRECHEKIHSK